ncbi:MAG TPA: APC family permease [Chthoniobacter sp.]|jgi:amino acid transporter
MPDASSQANSPPPEDHLERGLGVIPCVALNISNMVGIGPFITIPLMLTAMGGPQAMVAWVLGAVLTLCDGLVWSELGAALPGTGGTYHYLREVFGGYRWGRLLPFLFIWQFLISGPLEIASGYIGGLDYVKYIAPGLEGAVTRWHLPGGLAVLAALACIALTPLLCARIRYIGQLGIILGIGTLITMLAMIAAGLANFHPSLLHLPPGAFHFNLAWVLGFSGALRIAIYDYLGYYNICYLGGEVRQPSRAIPRAILWSVVIIAVLYMTMNLCVIAVIPWQEAMQSQNIGSLFMERLFGRGVAVVFTGFIIWTAVASVLALTLAYSRIPYAAAIAGDFFRSFARLDARGHYPKISLFAVTAATAAFCFVSLQDLIDAAVTVRILIQFVGQIVALHLLRKSRRDQPLPFRMWLYPLPALIALAGWIFMWASSGAKLIGWGAAVIVSGIIVFFVWQQVARRAEQHAA